MKKFFVLLLLWLFLVFGCTGQNQSNSGVPTQTTNLNTVPTKTCTNVSSSEPYTEQVCQNIQYQESYLDQECNTVPYTDTVCDTKQLIYNTGGNPNVLSACAQQRVDCLKPGLFGCAQTQTVCTSYGYSCSLVINNLDDEGGRWYVKIGILNTNGQNLSLKSLNSNYAVDMLDNQVYVQPRSSYTVSFNPTTNTPDVRGLETSYCSIAVYQVPTKQVCRDVIKTKEVCNQVTKYRPATRQDCQMVTKYKEIVKEVCT
ncbi:hypothetical protein HZC07_01295 [Candidatus Micrarchaeota archaeon]|nr:hypothetical protein [Candidatus Micrarchaeota archaeon]